MIATRDRHREGREQRSPGVLNWNAPRKVYSVPATLQHLGQLLTPEKADKADAGQQRLTKDIEGHYRTQEHRMWSLEVHSEEPQRAHANSN